MEGTAQHKSQQSVLQCKPHGLTLRRPHARRVHQINEIEMSDLLPKRKPKFWA